MSDVRGAILPPTPGRSRLAIAAAACVVLPLEGVLIAMRPVFGAAVAGLVIIVVGFTQVRTQSYRRVWLATVVLLAALSDLPRRIDIGEFSTLGFLTLALAFLSLPIWLGALSSRVVPRAWALLVLWVVGTLLINPPATAGVQNVSVLALFLIAIITAASVTRSDGNTDYIDRLMSIGSGTAVVLYGASVAVGGLETNLIFEPRAFALFALVALAWSLPFVRYRRRRIVRSAGLLLLIVLSLSRTAFVVALLISGLNGLKPRTLVGWLKSLGAVALALGSIYLSIQTIQPLHNRFFEGDVVAVGGSSLDVNVMGRAGVWEATWDSALQAPILGNGPGSSEAVSGAATNGEVTQPHNEYLRLFNDYGLIGLSLWLIGYLGILRGATLRSFGRRRAPLVERHAHLGAALGLVAVGLAALTDNPFVYSFVVVPLGVLVGSSLGLASRGGVTSTRFRPRQAASIRS